jgi:hypothetical protein
MEGKYFKLNDMLISKDKKTYVLKKDTFLKSEKPFLKLTKEGFNWFLIDEKNLNKYLVKPYTRKLTHLEKLTEGIFQLKAITRSRNYNLIINNDNTILIYK